MLCALLLCIMRTNKFARWIYGDCSVVFAEAVPWNFTRQRATVRGAIESSFFCFCILTWKPKLSPTIRHISRQHKKKQSKRKKNIWHRTYAMQNGNKNEIEECSAVQLWSDTRSSLSTRTCFLQISRPSQHRPRLIAALSLWQQLLQINISLKPFVSFQPDMLPFAEQTNKQTFRVSIQRRQIRDEAKRENEKGQKR